MSGSVSKDSWYHPRTGATHTAPPSAPASRLRSVGDVRTPHASHTRNTSSSFSIESAWRCSPPRDRVQRSWLPQTKNACANLRAKRRRVVSRTSRSSETSPPSITASPRKSTSLRDRTHSRFSGKSVWMSEHAKTRAGRGTFASGASTEPLADADMLEAEEETEARGSVRRGREKTGAMTGEGRRVGASARGFDAGGCARVDVTQPREGAGKVVAAARMCGACARATSPRLRDSTRRAWGRNASKRRARTGRRTVARAPRSARRDRQPSSFQRGGESSRVPTRRDHPGPDTSSVVCRDFDKLSSKFSGFFDSSRARF